MGNITQILRQLRQNGEQLDGLPQRLLAIAQKLKADEQFINPHVRDDVMSILGTSADMCTAMLEDTYPTEEIILASMNVLGAVQRVITYLELHRPRQTGYAIYLNDQKRILPQMCSSPSEAEHQMDTLRLVAPNLDASIIPIRITSNIALRPGAADPTPPPPPPPTSTSSKRKEPVTPVGDIPLLPDALIPTPPHSPGTKPHGQ